MVSKFLRISSILSESDVYIQTTFQNSYMQRGLILNYIEVMDYRIYMLFKAAKWGMTPALRASEILYPI